MTHARVGTENQKQNQRNSRDEMALRSLFLALRNRSGRDGGIFSTPKSSFPKLFSSGPATASEDLLEDSSGHQEDDDLKSRIFRLRLPKRSAANILQKWINEGNQISISELRNISKELRKSQRYKHALEISEWMISHEEFELSDSDYAVRIDLMTKVFGVDAAERYFEDLPLTAKTAETYTALLHSFARAKLTQKAEELYERIKKSNLSFNALTYNEMMSFYVSVGEVEKVSLVVEDLKHKNVAPDLLTYNLWISSCAARLHIDEVRRILEEMIHASGFDENWLRYVNLANIYVTAGHLVNAESNLVVETEKSITQREWITYDFLIIHHAGMGKKETVDQIWKSLRMTKQRMTSRNYVCVLSSYLMLGHLEEVSEVIDQWKQSTTTEFDVTTCHRILDAFADNGLTEEANNLRVILIQKNLDPSNGSE